MEETKLLCKDHVLPDQLRGRDDASRNGFIAHSIRVRLSTIVGAVKGFEEFKAQLQNGSFSIRQLAKDDGGPDWEQYIRDEIARARSNNCMDVSWFFLENYAYRLILGETGYFRPDTEGHLRDPWRSGKVESLETALPAFKLVCEEVPKPRFGHLVLCSLWGNRSDLSLSSGAVDGKVASGSVAGKLLVDHTLRVEEHLEMMGNGKIIIVLDNCGAELLADLRMAASLCTFPNEFHVALHVKSHPVFVSDATRADVLWHVDRMCMAGIELGHRVKELLAQDRIHIVEDPFYTSPLEFPYASEHLKTLYGLAKLVIVKGDANYRRILCDRYFPNDFPFAPLVKAFSTTPLLAVRTCKSPVIVGLDKKVLDEVAKADPDWCVNGTCGLIQFSQAN